MNDFEHIPITFMSILCIGMLLIPIFVVLAPALINKGSNKKTFKVVFADQGNQLVLFFAILGILLLSIFILSMAFPMSTGDHFYIMTPTSIH